MVSDLKNFKMDFDATRGDSLTTMAMAVLVQRWDQFFDNHQQCLALWFWQQCLALVVSDLKNFKMDFDATRGDSLTTMVMAVLVQRSDQFFDNHQQYLAFWFRIEDVQNRVSCNEGIHSLTTISSVWLGLVV